ncbi:MAG: DUF1499 domain-containing protein, partial [Gammaproteobacteria bacterium]|nr:DUF1499 domain-containing protein [Gammaproteobacteria bacterium]
MTTWWSRVVLLGAVAATALLPIGALGSRLGLWGIGTGIQFLRVGGWLAVIVALIALAAVAVAWRRRLPNDLRASAIGLVICLLAAGYVGQLQYSFATVPPIHHVSTDTEDPPPFIEVVGLRGTGSNSLDFDAETTAPLQAEFFPWVVPLTTPAPPEATFAKALAALQGMGLEIVAEHPQQGLIEATATTFWFGFKDDVAVRVRPHPQGAL